MFAYYLDLAFRSLRRHRVLTALMVLAIALGIGASMTMLTVLHILSGDPLPDESAHLYVPQLDPRGKDDYAPGQEPPDQLTYPDAMNLLHAHRANRQAVMVHGSEVVIPQGSTLKPFRAQGRFTSADFFPMFEVPFAFGHPWGAAEDAAKAHVVVISKKVNDRLFGGQNSVGRTLRYGGADFRIAGVLAHWRPVPHFYDLISSSSYGEADEVYLPFSTSRALHFQNAGNTNCWGDGAQKNIETAPCTWLQFWVELDSEAEAARYKTFLIHYSEQQKTLGRFTRPTNVRLRNLMAWLSYKKVVPSDVRLQAWLALGFLLACLLNTVGLLLAKFLRRSPEIGVRRALGASKQAVFTQLLVEAGVVGLAGGIAGVGMAVLGLWAIRRTPASFADLAHLDLPMLGISLALAIGASLLAGLLPAWRACQVTPALQLKSN